MIQKDAADLYTEKAGPVVEAAVVASQRMVTNLSQCLVDWKPFLIEREDVKSIKEQLIGNEHSSIILAAVRNLRSVKEFMDGFLLGLGKGNAQETLSKSDRHELR